MFINTDKISKSNEKFKIAWNSTFVHVEVFKSSNKLESIFNLSDSSETLSLKSLLDISRALNSFFDSVNTHKKKCMNNFQAPTD